MTTDPLVSPVAAVSCGMYAGQPVLDLDYPEDSEAGVDGNFILRGDGRIIEVQMSAEGATFSRDRDGHTRWTLPKRAWASSSRCRKR